MSRNLLDQETSPYLLQHRHNPVHWRPWGADALTTAKAEKKPILLSIGYAACHWCHVMAHESFEDGATADLMNALFVCIKVDREERPDLDMIYQSALSMLGQPGGWPLTMFLTPEGEPFWGGTYFPPIARYGRPSFKDVLSGVAKAWQDDPQGIAGNVKSLLEGLQDRSLTRSGEPLTLPLLNKVTRHLLGSVDMSFGGLLGAPKFPHVPLFLMLWRSALRNQDQEQRQAVLLTLERMCQGGIYDHLGGGFARYSTDEEWLVPHFEKMLYDNAQLLELLILVWQETRQPLFAQRIEETVGWVLREMLTDGGCFAATLDADTDGQEAATYVWRLDQIEDALPHHLRQVFIQAYGVTAHGNWEGKTILNRSGPQPRDDGSLEAKLAEARPLLLEIRKRRSQPGRDDKVLADWNGMMIAALAKAGYVFEQSDWLDSAERAFSGVQRYLGQFGGRLSHSYRQGRKQADAMLDDYAQMSRAALTLYEITGKSDYLAQAETWVALVEVHYWDADKGGYFFTADDAETLILRSKTGLDNATPSGNGVMVEVLARLYFHTGRDHYRSQAEAVIAAFTGEIGGSFPNMGSLLNGWELLTDARQLTITPGPAEPFLQREAALSGQPNLVMLRNDSSKPVSPACALAYVCRGQTCGPALSNPVELKAALS